MACALAFLSLESSNKVSTHLQCSICLDRYKDPVTTACGHTFCMGCLEGLHRFNDLKCPLCKTFLSGGQLNVNVILKAMVEEEAKAKQENASGPDAFSGAAGEVACDVCPDERKLRSAKSCLTCLSSYCMEHLIRHDTLPRLKGHKLVAPLEDLDQRACLTHGRALELYRPDGCGQQGCVCALCVEEGDVVIPMETARDRKKTELEKTKNYIKEKIQERVRKLTEFQTLSLNCKGHIDAEEREVQVAFEEVLKAVRSAQEEALRPLRERRRRVEEEEQALREELEEEIRKLEDVVTDLTQLEGLEDPIQFIQKYPTEPDLKQWRDWTDVTIDTELNFRSLRNIRATMLKEIEAELDKLTALEISRIQKCLVDVTLDRDTANPHLKISEDGKEVSHGNGTLDVPDGPQRFDTFGSVLGCNQLDSGCAYWEVEVGDKTGWDIGVASEAANRKGQISFKPAHGYWALVLYGEGQYAALTDPRVSLSLTAKPEKVGVFVDREEGLVSFYDVQVKAHIYSFIGCSFPTGQKLFPYFSPHLPHGERNSAPLVISPVNQGA